MLCSMSHLQSLEQAVIDARLVNERLQIWAARCLA